MTLLAFLLACSGDPAKPDDSAPLGDTDDPTTPEDDTGDTTPDPNLTAQLSGTLVDAEGNAVADARVNVCRQLCKTVSTETDGSWSYGPIEAWSAMFYVIPDPDSDFSHPMIVLTLADGEVRELDIVLDRYDTPRAMPTTAEEVEVTEGLYLTVGADILEPPPLEDLATEVAAVRVQVEHRLPIELTGEVLDVFYLSPWEATSEAGVAIRFDNTWGLAPGDRARVWATSEPTEYAWLDAGEVVVSEDGLVLEGDASLPILTTVALVRE